MKIVETYRGAAEASYLSNVITQIELADGAHVEHYRVQDESPAAFHIGSTITTLARDSEFISHSIAIGARLSRQDITVNLDAEGASASLNGLYACRGRQHVDHHTVVEHRAPRTRSVENYRGILADHSRGVFNGRVVVHAGAQKTDVRCSHGATVGQLDQQALFYLRSRGISDATARALLTYAFADDVLSSIGIPAIRRNLEQNVIGMLPEAERLRNLL